MANIFEGTRDKLTTLALRLLPELSAKPLYVIFFEEVGLNFPDADGCVMRNGDALVRELLGGKWRGRGPAIFLCLGSLRVCRPGRHGLPESLNEFCSWLAECFDITLAHELAHVVDAADVFDPPPNAPLPAASALRARVQRFLHEQPPPATSQHTWPTRHADSLAGHRAAFWRAFAHIGYRLGVATGRGFDFEQLRTDYYGLSRSSDYYAAIRNEIPARATERVADIIKSPLPTALAQLWTGDIERMGSSHILPHQETEA
jgi:hypothetical protein